MSRFLVVTIRSIAEGRAADYDRTWARLGVAVEHAGGRAWRFRSPQAAGRHIEFIEWTQAPEAPALTQRIPVQTAMSALDRNFGTGSREIWEEAQP